MKAISLCEGMTTELDELERLIAKAHPGRWEHWALGPGSNRIVAPDSGWAIPTVVGAGTDVDLAAIVALWNAAPTLLPYVRRLQAVAEAAALAEGYLPIIQAGEVGERLRAALAALGEEPR